MKRLWILPLFLFMLMGIASPQSAQSKYTPSLRYTCFDSAFLSVSVSAPRHDSFVNVELGLTDPKGRTAGMDHGNSSIEGSRYGKVVEMPSHPESSKAVAVEICGAIPGMYLISVSEHGNFDYRLTVDGDDGTRTNQGNESQPVNLHADGERLCRFRFNLQMAKGKLEIDWIDTTGRPLALGEFPHCEPIPRT